MPSSYPPHSPDTPPAPGQNHDHGAGHSHTHPATQGHLSTSSPDLRSSVLGWPAWQRLLLVLPVLLLLWLAVLWASAEVQPW
ncbi:hypothetical protein CKO18_19525 [Rhodoferax fermentans]|uniref:Uncharacterized protein n=1 Tax=Rhodoferax fermentans TaxID=28066 RepID=A0A1T1AQ39_RHOFE|nr:hypothetical protein [Rhodoferax fermentans]OOV06145.1 hypothetical protein RF819_04855 [Rhodoferax fermentans]